MHDVDEDLRTIPSQGGRWSGNVAAGTARREMNDSPSYSGNVASRCRHPKLIKYYTDHHNVDEDMMTITSYSGDSGNAVFSGIFARGSDNAPTEAWDIVASSDI